MANFVLIHGAWHGAWCWNRVLTGLRAAGHAAHAVTLTGVGERAHLLKSNTNLQTHIKDVLSMIEAEELDDLELVVHSYGGVVGTGVADKLVSAKIRHIYYLDAILPEPGESWSSTQTEETRANRLLDAKNSPLNTISAPDPSLWGLTGEDAAWVRRRMTPHPAATYTDILDFDAQRVASISRTYVSCSAPASATINPMRERAIDPKFWRGAWLPKSRFIEVPTGHDIMVSAPDALNKILLHR